MEEKDLEKLAATKLREIAKQYEGITGVHAMKKEELIHAIREARGEPKKPVKKEKVHTIGSLKKQIKKLKEEKKAALKKDKKTITGLRRKIKRYRRLTRKLAKGK
ncbi:MAG TPA: Rho termination factor N-terminal domain-containing protein [Thermodesulfobacteriota bacterium]|nr:Rho termination factor N-terminal domain-containing protein [Thermodesulfobacteriota bacterium]